MTKAELSRVVIKATTQRAGKRIIRCERALRIADEYQVSPRRVGKLCDDTGVKIRHCKLGCFA